MLKKKTWFISLILWYAIACHAQELRNAVYVGFLFTPDPFNVSISDKQTLAKLPRKRFFVWLVNDLEEKSNIFENIVPNVDTVVATYRALVKTLSNQELPIGKTLISKGDKVKIHYGGRTHQATIEGFLTEHFPVVDGIGGGRNLFAYGKIPQALLDKIKSEESPYHTYRTVIVSKPEPTKVLMDEGLPPFTISDEELRDYFIGRLADALKSHEGYLRTKIDTTTHLKYQRDVEIMKVPLKTAEEAYLLVRFNLTTDLIGHYDEKVSWSEVAIFRRNHSVAYTSGVNMSLSTVLAEDFNGDGFIEIVHWYSPWSTIYDVIQIEDNRFIKRTFVIRSWC